MNYAYEFGISIELLKQMFLSCTGENGEIPRNIPRSLYDRVEEYLTEKGAIAGELPVQQKA